MDAENNSEKPSKVSKWWSMSLSQSFDPGFKWFLSGITLLNFSACLFMTKESAGFG